MLVSVLLVLAALGLGWPLARRESDPLLCLGYAAGAGLAILAQLIFLLGLAGCLQAPFLWALLLLPALASRAALRRLPEALHELGWLRYWCLALALCALAPNTHVDVEAYHYALPELYARQDSLDWTWSSFCEGLLGPVHMLYIPALALGGEAAANLLGPLYLLLLLAGLLVVCRGLDLEGGKRAGWLLVSSPLVIFQALGGLVDLASSACACWALAAALRGQSRWAALWALEAVAIKWTAAVNLICLLLLPGGRRALGWGLLAATLILLPYLGRNAYHTGDPVYPLWKTWRVGQAGGLGASGKPARLSVGLTRWQRFPCNLVAWSGRHWQDAVNPLLWIGFLLALRRVRRLARVAGASWVMFMLVGPADLRYLLPALPWWACLAAARLQSWPGWLVRLSAVPGVLIVAALLVTRLPLLWNGREQYLRDRSPYSAYEYLRRHARPGERAYLLGRLGFRCPIDYVCGDARPKEGPAFAIDYYVVDLREPFVLPALLAHQTEGGPLRACSRGELRQIEPVTRRVLQVEQAFQAHIVYAEDRVLVLKR